MEEEADDEPRLKRRRKQRVNVMRSACESCTRAKAKSLGIQI